MTNTAMRPSATAASEPGSAAASTSDLSKRYGATQAVDQLNLHVLPGEVYGFLGPNGAGKTTTIRPLRGTRDRGHPYVAALLGWGVLFFAGLSGGGVLAHRLWIGWLGRVPSAPVVPA